MAYNLSFFMIAAVTFIASIFITSMVSLGSMLGFIIIVFSACLIHDNALIILALCLTVFIFYLHRNNIHKILNGSENLTDWGLYYWYLKYVKKSPRVLKHRRR